ncbi:hypothetical protein [Lutibacter sp. B1]|uniref:hypothetical protein n=1 Tax=Lutibacter sp. B1 TaxID=2725996 RepID=UPI0014566A02|nr:hypothetical protein [Lutibacter sp. B1]NLP59345.1 hypothetical protein [Lutibacter sp. B1]
MSEKFNPKDVVQNFIEHRERYFKSRINEHRFYSEKYQFLFGIEFRKENNKSANCYYHWIENLEQSFDLLKELDVFELDKAKNKLFMINKSFDNGCDFPCYIILCEKFIRLDP